MSSSTIQTSTPRVYSQSAVACSRDRVNLQGLISIKLDRVTPERATVETTGDGMSTMASLTSNKNRLAILVMGPGSQAAGDLAEQEKAQEGWSEGAMPAVGMRCKDPSTGKLWSCRHSVIIRGPSHEMAEKLGTMEYQIMMLNPEVDEQGDL